jgi:hypothetical protein
MYLLLIHNVKIDSTFFKPWRASQQVVVAANRLMAVKCVSSVPHREP